jgi:FkbM family methyltransferase
MNWEPPSTLEERLKDRLVPPRLYIRYRAWKELRRGEAEIRLLPFLVARDRVALDVGANKGVWTHFLSRLSRHVHAFEPNPKIFRVLKRGIARNVTAHQVALSNAAGTAEFRVPRRKGGYSNQGGSLSAVNVSESYATMQVETRRLDDLGIADVGFMKIDVEGFEATVLEGAVETLRRDRPVLVIELEESHTRQSLETLVAGVEAHGYRALALCRGVLTDLRRIDVEKHHRRAAVREDYIFNFIFLPT